MRIHLVINEMLNGQSLQMCRDYWQTCHPNNPFGFQLERHIQQVRQRYDVTFEELFSRLMFVRAYDSAIRCKHCGQMYEVLNPSDLPNPHKFLDWECDK